MTAAKPLTTKQEAFARAYAGDGVAAARLAGYTGGAAGLAVTASRLLKDARVQAILAERRAADRGESAPPPPPSTPAVPPKQTRVNVAAAVDEAKANGVDPIKILADIAKGTDVHPSSRVAAAKALERHQRETNASSADPFAELRAAMNEIIRAKRAREREEESR